MESSFAKPCCACHGAHSNPVINRNGADEVQTRLRNEGKTGLIVSKMMIALLPWKSSLPLKSKSIGWCLLVLSDSSVLIPGSVFY